MNETQVELVDSQGDALAQLLVWDEEEGWFSGRILAQRFPSEIAKDLAWYDEVVQDQMLSYLDQALAAVERWSLGVRFRDGSAHPVYSLQISPSSEVSFRLTPIPPAPDRGARI